MARPSWFVSLLCGLLSASAATAAPPGAAARARLAAGQSLQVVVEYEARAVDQAAAQERTRRRLNRDDAAVRALRTRGYAAIKIDVDAALAAPDAARLRDYAELPLTLWRVDTPAALARLQSQPGVRAVHEDRLLRGSSVSDLPFIHQPEAAAQGDAGTGTVVAVIDGGLGSYYQQYTDFGPCTAVGQPAGTCRVKYIRNYYSGAQASRETTHGTNVSAIALGVAPGARLAMYNVFGWFDTGGGNFASGAKTSDVLDAMNRVLGGFNAATNNVVAVNLSLGDNGTNPATCAGSAFASAIAALADAGIATVVAAGNSGVKDGLADPACAPRAVSVGAVYSQVHGPVTWAAPAACTENGMPDQVACFSQSADYLTVLAPGLFVDAPDAGFEESGTSQAAPHVSGALAVLRARYAAEPVTQSVQRLRDTGEADADAPGGGRVVPRMDLLAALHEAARLDLAVSGPADAARGRSDTFTLTVTNRGALTGTGVRVQLSLPAGTTVLAAGAGCTASGALVTCVLASLDPGFMVSFTVQVRWNYTGMLAGNAALAADQINASNSQLVALDGGEGDATGDAPLPWWASALLALLLLAALGRGARSRPAAVPLLATRGALR